MVLIASPVRSRGVGSDQPQYVIAPEIRRASRTPRSDMDFLFQSTYKLTDKDTYSVL
jgi:hypothetical protein